MIRATPALVTFLCLTIAAPRAGGYATCGFHDRAITMTAIHWNSEFWVDMLVNEAAKWNSVHRVLNISRTRSNTVPLGQDGRSVISWIAEADLIRAYNLAWSDAVGWTIIWYEGDCGRIIEADQFYNPAISLFAPQAQTPYKLGFQEISLHELGHVLTHDHEDRSLAVMTGPASVSDVLYTSDKVGWLRSAMFRFSVTDRHDMGVFPLRNKGTNKTFSILSPKIVQPGSGFTINNFTVQNLSSGFVETNPKFQVVLENTGTGAVIDVGSFFWSLFCAYCSWDGKLTFQVPRGTPVATYRVVAIFQGTDSDSSNNRAVFGTLRVAI